jgi:hypothetical protein
MLSTTLANSKTSSRLEKSSDCRPVSKKELLECMTGSGQTLQRYQKSRALLCNHRKDHFREMRRRRNATSFHKYSRMRCNRQFRDMFFTNSKTQTTLLLLVRYLAQREIARRCNSKLRNSWSASPRLASRSIRKLLR